MPRDAVSRTANVEHNGGHKWVNNGDVFFLTQEATENEIVYDLTGLVSKVSDSRFPELDNLVATVKVGQIYHYSPVENWYLFNDIR